MKTLTLILAISLAGCSTIKVPAVSGGSKSDGIVNASYNYATFESPVVDLSKTMQSAKVACSNWGYSNAVKLSGESKQCVNYDYQYGCTLTRVDTKYQCID